MTMQFGFYPGHENGCCDKTNARLFWTFSKVIREMACPTSFVIVSIVPASYAPCPANCQSWLNMGTLTDRPQSHGIVVPACVAVTSQVFPQSHETENVIVVLSLSYGLDG